MRRKERKWEVKWVPFLSSLLVNEGSRGVIGGMGEGGARGGKGKEKGRERGGREEGKEGGRGMGRPRDKTWGDGILVFRSMLGS